MTQRSTRQLISRGSCRAGRLPVTTDRGCGREHTSAQHRSRSSDARHRRAVMIAAGIRGAFEESSMATQVTPKDGRVKPQRVARRTESDWTRPQAMAIPKEGYFEHEEGN